MFIRPDYNLKSIYDINLEELKQNGIKGMLFDLDSTLMASKSGEYSKEVLDWLDIVKKNFFVGVISNNHNSKYVEKVTKISNFPVLFNAEKPRVKKAMKFITKNGLKPKECAFVGDRPLTDVLCGKNLGCTTIMVDSITADTEHKIVRFVRFLEKLTVSH